MNKLDIRGEICKIISEMLDNPGECGIYQTTRCYDKLETLFAAASSRNDVLDVKIINALESSLKLWEADARLWPAADKIIKPLIAEIRAIKESAAEDYSQVPMGPIGAGYGIGQEPTAATQVDPNASVSTSPSDTASNTAEPAPVAAPDGTFVNTLDSMGWPGVAFLPSKNAAKDSRVTLTKEQINDKCNLMCIGYNHPIRLQALAAIDMKDEVERLTKEKDSAYEERNKVVSAPGPKPPPRGWDHEVG